MSNEFYTAQRTAAAGAVDKGLQGYMQGVFKTMSLGLGVTALAAFAVNATPLFDIIFGTPLRWVAVLAPLAFIWLGFTPQRVARLSAEKLRSTFFLFSAIMGVSMAGLFAYYDGVSIARVFFVTAAMFAGTSLLGYTTKRDLTRMGSFMIMGMIGVFLASIINLFFVSPGLQFAISIIGVVVFTALAAWEVQMLKQSYAYGRGLEDANNKLAVMGALNLYMSFINMFQFLLSLMGDRR